MWQKKKVERAAAGRRSLYKRQICAAEQKFFCKCGQRQQRDARRLHSNERANSSPTQFGERSWTSESCRLDRVRDQSGARKRANARCEGFALRRRQIDRILLVESEIAARRCRDAHNIIAEFARIVGRRRLGRHAKAGHIEVFRRDFELGACKRLARL